MFGIQQAIPSLLGRRLLITILAFSTVVTLFATVIILLLDYKRDVSIIQEHQKRIQEVYLKQLSLDLWEFDLPGVELKLQGLLNYPENDYVYVVLKGGEKMAHGNPEKQAYSELIDYELIYEGRNIGTLFIQVNYGYLYDRLLEKTISILITQFFKTFIVSLFILIIVHQMITKHLHKMARFARDLTFESLDKTLELKRQRQNDELQVVTDSLNLMSNNLKKELEHRVVIEQQLIEDRAKLAELNVELENKVNERTTELRQTNSELSVALDNVNAMIGQLQETQKQLVIREKMLATGGMVVGLAHELNTPIGICKTSISAISDFVDTIKTDVKNNQLSKNSLNSALDDIMALTHMSESNIDRITGLIETFKELSVSQECETLTEIDIASFLDEFSSWARSRLTPNISLTVTCRRTVTLETFATSLQKVLQSLIDNAATHAFNEGDTGRIYLNVEVNNTERSLNIAVSDDGRGIHEEDRQRIFEPFFTTRRNQGGLGLGLNIIYNLVTQALGGTIECLDSPYGGICFNITLPLDLRTKKSK
ncbi:sensor histidine kinase [Litoribacillus peritrichatus]|uniref:histidine kinase n=1 Tax=Litoribacillus peritrichatus TaxID=718191 RepID=A0ABP7M8R1_9GAMM